MSHKWTGTAAAVVLCGALGISQPAAAQVYGDRGGARTIAAGVNVPIRTSEAITSSAEDGRIGVRPRVGRCPRHHRPSSASPG